MPNGYPFIGVNPVKLMEHWYVRNIRLTAIALLNVNNAQWQFARDQRPGRTGCGVWRKNKPLTVAIPLCRAIHKKSFPLVTRRMIGRHIQRFKGVPITLHFGMTNSFKTNLLKNSGYFINGLTDEMCMTKTRRNTGQSNINWF